MKSLAVIGLIVVIAIFFTACVSEPKSASEQKESNAYNLGWNKPEYWEVVKSPLTGRCYEVFDKYSPWSDSSLGMSEIPCSEYEKLKNK